MYMLTTADIVGVALVVAALAVCAYVYFSTSDFQLKCVVSGVNGSTYCVRDRARLTEAADLLARVTEKGKKLVAYLKQKHPENETVAMLVRNYNPDRISETLPTSAYTAYSENKGEKLAFCLNVKKNGDDKMIDEHTLTFVYIHEMAHTCTTSIGHKADFWDTFKFLLEEAKAAGIHEPRDYSVKPTEYCGMKVKDSPYFKE
jgi:molybdopterin synthase catalytic subunit